MKKFLIFLLLISLMIVFCSVSYAKVKFEVPETVRIKLNDGEIIEIDLDEYLYGVVSSEMGTSYYTNGKYKDVGIEALKAQAIASRSYAVYNIQHSKYDGYDMTATTSDQVYKKGNVKDIVKKAVDSTSGQVMTYDGEIISAYFFSTSGGHTESSENVWVAALPYARGVKDPYEPYIEGKSEWEARIPASEYGEIKIIERSENDRVIKLKIGNTVYEKSNIRSKLGATFIKSTWFDLEYDEDTDEYVFNGKGYGHGVGMSQYGAMGMAEEEFDYEEILTHYYTGVKIVPDNVEYIVIDEKENEENSSKEDEKDTDESDKIIKEEKNYRDEEPVIKESTNTKENTNTKEDNNTKEKGPLLQKIIALIKSWR